MSLKLSLSCLCTCLRHDRGFGQLLGACYSLTEQNAETDGNSGNLPGWTLCGMGTGQALTMMMTHSSTHIRS